jgi:hypothetical protein
MPSGLTLLDLTTKTLHAFFIFHAFGMPPDMSYALNMQHKTPLHFGIMFPVCYTLLVPLYFLTAYHCLLRNTVN